MGWTTPSELKTQVQKWWDSGELLCATLVPDNGFPRRLRFKTPTSSEIADRFDEVRAWVSSLRTAPHCRIEMRSFNHRVFGKNSLPAEVWLDSPDAALTWIGKQRDAAKFAHIVKLTTERHPLLMTWLQRRPLRALELYNDWEKLLDVVAWVVGHPRPDIYLREMDLPGVHTKFVEANRGTLIEMLDLVLPSEAIDTDASGVGQFARRYGFREKPFRIRFRLLDPALQIIPGVNAADITLTEQGFIGLKPSVTTVFITENEINFLAFPEFSNALVIFGAGYGFDYLAEVGWLKNCKVIYWGDIDTHGFAILNSVRKYVPHVEAMLMDEQTLLDHRDMWGDEPVQHNAVALPHLTQEEHAMYLGLKENMFRKNVRLEQERISWHYVRKRMAAINDSV